MPDSVFTLPDGSSFSIIKPLIGFRSQIKDQLRRFPYEKNVFLMMRFRTANKPISDAIIDILNDNGLTGVRADQPAWSITGNVFNPVAVLYCCKYGIALFDKAEANQTYSPNVIYELGMMQCLERPCLILKKDSLPPMPFDLLSSLYKPYKGVTAVSANVRIWLQERGLKPVQAPSAVKTKEKIQLENRAVSTAGKIHKPAEIVQPPDGVKATDFAWTVKSIKSKKAKKQTVSWGLKIMNKGDKAARYRVQVIFVDENGFALDDQAGPTSKPVLPGKSFSYKATSTLSSELAKRIKRVIATVSALKR